MKIDNKRRCGWMGDDKLMLRYHDDEWGSPLHNDRKRFEFIVLDAFQAGLSWRTVLHKRKAFLKLQKQHGTFDAFIWSFTKGKVVQNSWKRLADIRQKSPTQNMTDGALGLVKAEL